MNEIYEIIEKNDQKSTQKILIKYIPNAERK